MSAASALPASPSISTSARRQAAATAVSDASRYGSMLEDARERRHRRGPRRRRAHRHRPGRQADAAAAVALPASVAMTATLDDAQQADPRRTPSTLAAVDRPQARPPTCIDAAADRRDRGADRRVPGLDRVGAPHLVIRCDPSSPTPCATIATEPALTTSGFTGRLVVIGDPEIAARRRAASNGPMAASSATAAPSAPRSTTASPPISPPAASPPPKET